MAALPLLAAVFTGCVVSALAKELWPLLARRDKQLDEWPLTRVVLALAGFSVFVPLVVLQVSDLPVRLLFPGSVLQGLFPVVVLIASWNLRH